MTEEKSDVPLTHRSDSIPEGTNTQPQDIIQPEYDSSEDLADALESQCQNEKAEESLPQGYFIKDGGLYYAKVSQGEVSDENKATYIGDELHVVAAVSNENGGGHARVVKFHERTRNIDKEVTLSVEALYKDNTEALSLLASEGYFFALDRSVKSLLVGYITKSTPRKILFSVFRGGWLSDQVFVLPTMVISNSGQQDIHYTGPIQAGIFSSKGTLESWQQQIAMPTFEYPSLLFSMCSAFAAPLLRVLKVPGGGFHLHGASGTGKTTALRVAASVIGSEGYITTWRATSNGLEAVSEAYNDLLLPLDEIHQIDPHEIPESVYLIANGRGRQRANRQGDRRLPKSWNVLGLSCGESSIEDLCSKLPEGVRNRLVDVEFGNPVPASICGTLSEAVKDHHGTAIVPYIQHVVSNVHAIREEWRKCRTLVDHVNGTTDRVTSRFFF